MAASRGYASFNGNRQGPYIGCGNWHAVKLGDYLNILGFNWRTGFP